MSKTKYKVIGPHVVVKPPKMEVTEKDDVQDAFTPIDKALEKWELEDWELVTLIPGFGITLQTKIAMQNQPRMTLTAVCAMLRKK